jgi:hypothetical protein
LNIDRAHKLNKTLNNIPRRTLKDAHDRIIGDGNKAAGAIRRMVNMYRQKPRDAFNLWKKYVNDVKNG